MSQLREDGILVRKSQIPEKFSPVFLNCVDNSQHIKESTQKYYRKGLEPFGQDQTETDSHGSDSRQACRSGHRDTKTTMRSTHPLKEQVGACSRGLEHPEDRDTITTQCHF
jgi:hypothetical protein